MMQSPRFLLAMSFVVFLCSARFAVADVSIEKRMPSHHTSSGPVRYVYHPHFCQSFLLTIAVSGNVWAVSYSSSRGVFAQMVDLSNDMPSSAVWVTIDAEDPEHPYDGRAATIRPYDDQSLAFTAEEDQEVLSLQKIREGAHHQAWSIMLVPTATFFKLGGSAFSLNHRYMSFANNSNGVLQMKKSFFADSAVFKIIDPITGQSCAAYLDKKYNHMLY